MAGASDLNGSQSQSTMFLAGQSCYGTALNSTGHRSPMLCSSLLCCCSAHLLWRSMVGFGARLALAAARRSRSRRGRRSDGHGAGRRRSGKRRGRKRKRRWKRRKKSWSWNRVSSAASEVTREGAARAPAVSCRKRSSRANADGQPRSASRCRRSRRRTRRRAPRCPPPAATSR